MPKQTLSDVRKIIENANKGIEEQGPCGIIYRINPIMDLYDYSIIRAKYSSDLEVFISNAINATKDQVEALVQFNIEVLNKLIIEPRITADPADGAITFKELPKEEKEFLASLIAERFGDPKKARRLIEKFRTNKGRGDGGKAGDDVQDAAEPLAQAE